VVLGAPLRIALLQLTSHGWDRDANLAKGERFCRQAATKRADIALFPEMWSVGYRPFDPDVAGDREHWLSLAVGREDPFLQHFRRLAAELGMAIGITYLEKWTRVPRNSLTVFDRHGEEALTYAKVHLGPWDPPDNACAPGDDFPVACLDTAAGPVRTGAMICFDREFPESARMLMLGGAELILTPNSCDLDDEKSGIGDIRIAQFRARAFENLLAVAMANYAAPQQDGRSVAFYPDGALVVQGEAAEGIVIADVDLDRVRRWRRQEVGRDEARSPGKYAAVADPDHPRPLR